MRKLVSALAIAAGLALLASPVYAQSTTTTTLYPPTTEEGLTVSESTLLAGESFVVSGEGADPGATYKAVFYGSRVVEVPARHTSLQCSHCGHTAQENRESQAVFRCRACGWGPVNADYNAAVNIRERGIKLAPAPGPGVAARGALGVGRAARREPRSGPRITEVA